MHFFMDKNESGMVANSDKALIQINQSPDKVGLQFNKETLVKVGEGSKVRPKTRNRSSKVSLSRRHGLNADYRPFFFRASSYCRWRYRYSIVGGLYHQMSPLFVQPIRIDNHY